LSWSAVIFEPEVLGRGGALVVLVGLVPETVVGHLRWISVDEESLTLLLVEEVVVGVLEEARAGRWTVLILEDRGWLLLAFVVLAAAVVAIG